MGLTSRRLVTLPRTVTDTVASSAQSLRVVPGEIIVQEISAALAVLAVPKATTHWLQAVSHAQRRPALSTSP